MEHCEQCPPSCLIQEFTAECTDQCLVLACDDPDHADAVPARPCDGTCAPAPDCTDCTGLDEIFQCCTDYHSYSTFRWGPSPCECPPAIHALIADASISSSPSSSPSLPPFSPQLRVPSPFLSPAHPFPCMWATCDAAFDNLSDLVGHVNLDHLATPNPQDHSPLPPHPQDDIIPNTPLSCHWGDCAMFPSPSSVPTSSASSDDDVLNFLITHLMQDHLGLNYPFPPALPPPLPDLHSPPVVVHQPSLSPAPPSHDCSGIHVCRWTECTQSFPSCDDLTAHIASVHVGGGKAHYECFWAGCNRHGTNGFSSKQKISRHLQSHTGHRPFQCQICSQNFSEAATLQQHMRRHTQEKPYVCDFPGCGKAFAITGALTIHKRTHNGLRPFKCKFCDKAFSESSNLSKHLRTHTGARPYECPQEGCGKTFARPDQLARHTNVHRKKNSKG